MTESADSMPALAGQFSFASDFSRWCAPLTITLIWLSTGWHAQAFGAGMASRIPQPRSRGFPAKRASGRPLGAGETPPHPFSPF